ncbi:PAS domain S-box protein [Methanococcoides sp. SA1]|nr:PAS domain S-box protein [Methanococcoides sp. SA1]
MNILEISKNITRAFDLTKDTDRAVWHLVRSASEMEGTDSVKAYLFDEKTNEFNLIPGTEPKEPAQDNTSMFTHCNAIFETITERNKVEQDLTESKEMFEIIAKSAKGAIIVVDNNAKISYWNKAAEEIFGYSEEEVIGYSPHQLIIADKYKEKAKRGFEAFRHTGKGNAIGKTLELTARRKNGEFFPVELSLSAIKLKDQWCSVSIVHDISSRKIAEEKLRQSEENYREVLASIDIVIWKADVTANGEFVNTYISPVVEKMLALEPGIIGNNWDEYMKYIHPDELPKIKSLFAESIRNPGQTHELEYRVISGKGKLQWFHSRGSCQFQPDGSLKMTGTTTDVTKEKLARDTIKERDDRLQSIFRAVPTGIGMSSNRVIKEVNEQLCKITGYTAEELIEAEARMLYPSIEDYTYVGTEKYDQMHKCGSGTVETRWQRKDGSIIDILLSSSPIDPTDLTKGVTFSALDITDRKHMENALKESNGRFRTIVEKATEAIFAYGLDGNIILANDLALKNTGYTKDELLAMNITDICDSDRFEGNEKVIEYKDAVFETKRLKKDGTAYPVEVRITPILFAGKQIILDLSHDISESNRAKEDMHTAKLAAEAANRTKSEFLANMSHELRTPLNSVIGFSEILMKQTSGEMSSKQKKYASNIHKNGKYLLDLINNILSLSKMETGEMDVHYTTFAPKRIIEEIELITRVSSNKKNIDVTIKTTSNTHIESDLRKFNTIVYNLLNNAIKFTPEHGSISIEENVVDDSIQVSVIDTGIGIAEEDIDKLFKPFGQLDSSHTRKFGGTGIGLVLVKKYIDMLGGSIRVESELDQGTKFIFTLPIKPEISYRK